MKYARIYLILYPFSKHGWVLHKPGLFLSIAIYILLSLGRKVKKIREHYSKSCNRNVSTHGIHRGEDIVGENRVLCSEKSSEKSLGTQAQEPAFGTGLSMRCPSQQCSRVQTPKPPAALGLSSIACWDPNTELSCLSGQLPTEVGGPQAKLLALWGIPPDNSFKNNLLTILGWKVHAWNTGKKPCKRSKLCVYFTY